MIKKPTKSEIDWWLQKAKSKNGFSSNEKLYQEEPSRFFGDLKTLLDTDSQTDISINVGNINRNSLNLSADKFVITNTIPSVALKNFNENKTVNLKNLAISQLTITSPGPTPEIVVENCLIKELKITNVPINLSLKNSGVFNLELPGKCLYDFHVDGGYILNIKCPAPHETNPISGSVTILDNVYLETKTKNRPLTGPQGYRNMRHHMQQLQNIPAVNRFHAAELATERETDNTTNKCFNYLYQWLSNYGNSISRPLIWLAILILGITSLSFFVDNPVLTDYETATGWREVLSEKNCKGQLARAITNTAQSTLNPWGILGYKAIIVPQHWWFLPINFIYNLFSIVLITLTILAIRRRFRIQSS